MLKNGVINIVFLLLAVALIASDLFGDIPVLLYVVPVILYLSLQVYGSIVLSAQFFVPVKFKASADDQAISLTFDDGPIAGRTDRILDILKKHNFKGTFFCIGNRVEKNPQLVKRIHEEGHLLGNHSYWHSKTFDLQFADKIQDELNRTDRIIRQSIGVAPRFFRPPYGVTNPMVAAAVRQGNYVTVGWSLRSFDTVVKKQATLFRRVTKRMKGGDIILFHDYSDSMIEMLPDFLDHVNKSGLKVVRVDELINEKPYV